MIRLGSTSPLVYFERGLSYVAVLQLEEAIRDFDESIRLDPRFAPGFIGRAITHSAMGLDVEAQEDVDSAVRLGADRETLESLIQ